MIKNKTLILGVGNQFRTDDAVALEVVKILQQQQLPKVEAIIGGIDGLALIDIIEKYERAIIVDAVEMGELPGKARIFSPRDAKIKIKQDALSTHGFGIAEVIKLLEKLDIKTKVKILGVQPQDVLFGEGLTEQIASRVPEYVEMIKNVLYTYDK